jgi:ATP-binding cassette subfamily B protein
LNQISTGDFVAFISYLNLLTWPMMAMGWVTNLVQRGSASMTRINEVLDREPEIRDAPGAVSLSRLRGDIRFEALSFGFNSDDRPVLADIHLRIRSGETVAVVGRVGAGKSTLLRMIPRLLDPPAGTVWVDGHDVRTLSLHSLRSRIGFVAQEVFVFSDTIGNNVRLGNPDVSEAQLEGALRAADVWEDVQALNSGVDTLLGERGITLSGGQRQRLTIARALAGDPAVLILDDGLSMVDTRTEKRILEQILKVRSGYTNLIVSHRVSTLSRVDRIVVLDAGRVVEEGSHETLLAAGGIYRMLYEKQLLEDALAG